MARIGIKHYWSHVSVSTFSFEMINKSQNILFQFLFEYLYSEMPISKNDKVLVLSKLSENLLILEPEELPTIAFQLFTLSSTPAQLMIPLISLNQYFQKYLYQKQFDQMSDSEPINFDSIGKFNISYRKMCKIRHRMICLDCRKIL